MTSLEDNITCEGNIVGKPDIILPCILERVILQGSRAVYYHTRDMLFFCLFFFFFCFFFGGGGVYDLFHCFCITKTCLYNFDPLKPLFYTVKLGFAGVYIIFVISAENINCRYSLEPPRRGGSNEYPQSMF